MASEATPMMKQYHALRRDLPPGTFLLFRLGDFYEMFFDDAKEASAILNVALTKRGEVPMCGVPYHAARGYMEKLLAAGRRVALCEQVGEVQAGKLVRREITRILSPGTLEDAGLEEKSHNFTAAVLPPLKPGGAFGLACADLSTGEFRVTELPSAEALLDEVVRVSPAEILVPEGEGGCLGDLPLGTARPEEVESYLFDPLAATELLLSHFKVHSLDGFGVGEVPRGVAAAGALLHYLTRSLRRDASHLRSLRVHHHADHLLLDASTQGHLELVVSRAGRAMTLMGTLDRTVTPMGGRTLRDWILHPLIDPATIGARQESVGAFIASPMKLGDLRDRLGGIRDIERAVSRLSQNSGTARDLQVLAASLAAIPAIRSVLDGCGGLLQKLSSNLHTLPELAALLGAALVDEPPPTIREGGMIRSGYDAALDELRNASTEGKAWIAALQEREITRTGIKSLKVRFNAVFGYFIEVTTANLGSVPDDYTRKQTTAGGERFVTPELKEMEGKILGSEERARALEVEIFQRLRTAVLDQVASLQETAASAGALDALGSLAETARLFAYTRPVVDDSTVLEIRDGRHPVLDQRAGGEAFVPNDTDLDASGLRMGIITGPNMAGKSTYLRQVGLLTVMAQMGSWIPAASARIGVADRIFTRVGASDDLSKGHSTFMVEMNETANILHNATFRSLVLLDEIGRGTATFDGLSIAWSVAEHLHDVTGCRAFFATHYHELPDLARTRKGVRNLNVAVREQNDRIIFLRKIVEGAADRSYGIQVARLAGLPSTVVERAREILTNLEKAELNAEGRPALAGTRRKSPGAPDPTAELPLFS
ncbi:MAG: DNA mismatch repair protein MutS [Proteobacteria bacterium]|nr:DNA mismatch repair protein MutS [Pseudomonadota bacterium]